MKRLPCRLFGLLIITWSLSVAHAAAPSARETLRKEALNISAWALSPLDETVPPDIRRNLTFLREDLLDEGKSAPKASADSFTLGSSLCDSLIAALDEHDASAVKAGYRAAQAKANTKITSAELEIRRNYKTSWPLYAREQTQRAEIARQVNNQIALANQQLRVEWANRGALIRLRLDGAYKYYRIALRNDPGFQMSDASSSDSLFPLPRPFVLGTNAALDSASASNSPPSELPQEVRDLLTPEFAALSIDECILRVTAKVKQMNPGFNGVINWTKDKSTITGINFPGSRLVSLWPLCSLPLLQQVSFHGQGKGGQGKGGQGKNAQKNRAPVSDLSPLRGMQLRELMCNSTEVKDLSLLTGMPLEKLNCAGTPVADLSPLQGMQLTLLFCGSTSVTDLSPLRGMPLHRLNISHTKIKDLAPLAGMPLQSLICDETQVVDFSPLKGMQRLNNLVCTFRRDRDAAILRSIGSLRHINGFPVKDFWKRVDAGESPQQEDSR